MQRSTPRSAEDYIKKGIRYAKRGYRADRLRALAVFSKAIKLEPNNDEAYYQRGLIYHDICAFRSALTDFDKAIALNPNETYHYRNRAATYNELREFDRALADLNKAIELDAAAGAYSERCTVYVNKKEFILALADINKAIELDATDWLFYDDRAEIHVAQGNDAAALSDYNKAVELNQDNGLSFCLRAMFYFEQGNYTAALSDLEKSSLMPPIDEEAQLACQEFKIVLQELRHKEDKKEQRAVAPSITTTSLWKKTQTQMENHRDDKVVKANIARPTG